MVDRRAPGPPLLVDAALSRSKTPVTVGCTSSAPPTYHEPLPAGPDKQVPEPYALGGRGAGTHRCPLLTFDSKCQTDIGGAAMPHHFKKFPRPDFLQHFFGEIFRIKLLIRPPDCRWSIRWRLRPQPVAIISSETVASSRASRAARVA